MSSPSRVISVASSEVPHHFTNLISFLTEVRLIHSCLVCTCVCGDASLRLSVLVRVWHACVCVAYVCVHRVYYCICLDLAKLALTA